ncbi:unnamed protein product [Lupinus luteus]|uniref:Protein kinase domain-containing protein n=1 Tax=Lupinus luteus TaxID=3873 RepID=A0AAV1XL42_LUPLU
MVHQPWYTSPPLAAPPPPLPPPPSPPSSHVSCQENKTLFYNLFMEYMPFGTLTQSTLRHCGRINEQVVAHYSRQVLQGLEYLHSKGLVHCDIKGSNILVNEDGAKISDFGCAKYVNNNELPPGAAAAISGTPMFMSPEVARGEEQGYPCDIWALGCTMVEIATGFAPWPNVEDPVSILYHVAYSNEVPEIPSFLSDQAKDFLGKCLMRNPKERWSASQLLKHPFVVEFNSKGKQILEPNSCSPTSILDHGFWNSVEESECHLGNNLVRTSLENSAAGRIRGLALRSRDPNWTWDDNNWITTIGNNEAVAEIEACGYGLFGSKTRNYCRNRNHVVSTNTNMTHNNYGYTSCYYCLGLHDPILCNNLSSQTASSSVGGDFDELEKSNVVCS